MSLIWFLFLMYAYLQGIKIGSTAFLMIAIFYVGDCVLFSGRKKV